MTAEVEAAPLAPAQIPAGRREVIYRHRFVVRLTHWVNALCLLLLLMSGLQIFNAHPGLYWGKQGDDYAHALVAIGEVDTPRGPRGVTRVGALSLDTTGLLGLSKVDGQPAARAWPAWLTLPRDQNLAAGRQWHFLAAWILVANGLIYLIWSFASRHVQRDLWPTGPDLRGFGRSVLDHIRLKHPKGEAARRYNVLQKLAYLTVVFVFLPMMVATGLTMSPGFDAIAPFLLSLFGGRQSARTLHFLAASGLVAFVIVHVVEVVLAGPVNELRSMITGRYALPRETDR
ncbi:MAG: cytochrome b/b6 domain-containing protein [Caulobacteraceae bacterium]